jgi:hypothetical protein
MKAVMAAAGFNSVNSWATTAGVSEGGIRAFFKGTVNSLNISTLEKLAAAAGRSVSALLGDSDAEAGEGSPRRGAGPAPNFALIPEILVTAGMGGGEIQEVETFGQDTVRDTWGLPRDFIREGRTQPENLRILPLKGDSMAPTLIGTDRAIIDIADRIPSPPGIFALWDGYGVIVKRVEIVPKTRPPRLRVISDNQMHQPYEIEGEEHTIIGRLRGLIRWL